MENVKDKGKSLTSDPQSKTNDLATFGTIETNVEEVIVVPNNDDKEENTKQGEDNMEENAKDVENDVMSEKTISETKVEGNSKKRKKVNKSKKRSKKMVSKDTVAKSIKDVDEPESSKKEKVIKDVNERDSTKKKKVESMGMIFMCSSKTKKDCYHYKVLGLPASKKEVVQKIYKGMRLFLFDFELRLMYGIYKAAGPGGYNIEPKAFKSAFPSQVRFSVLEDCLPLAEEKFKKVIKDNYYKKNKFNCELNADQVKNLCKLFRVASKGQRSKESGRSHRVADRQRRTQLDREDRQRRTQLDREDRQRRTQLDREEERHPVLYGERLYKEPHAVYARDIYASPRASRPLHAPLPLPPTATLPPSYAHGRTLEMEAYRRDPILRHHGRQHLDLGLRRQDEIEYRDPYVQYRETSFARDTMYSSGLPSGYHPPGLRPEYYPPLLSSEHSGPTAPRVEYYSLARPSSEYGSRAPATEYFDLRSSYRY